MRGKPGQAYEQEKSSPRIPTQRDPYSQMQPPPQFPPQYMMPFAHPSYMPQSQHFDYTRDGKLNTPKDQYPPHGPGMPQYIPVYMPMPSYPYFPSYFPQPYNYMQNYSPMKDRSILDESIGIDKTDRKTIKPSRVTYKTSDEIVNEFKSQTLPKLRLKRLIKMQAVMKGWHVRKFVLPRKKIMNKMLREITEKKINEWIEDRIVPDIVLELVTMNKYNKDYTLYSQGLRNYLEMTDNMIEKFVRNISRDIVRETTNNLAFEFLRMKKGELVEYDNNPFSLVAKGLITNFVKKNMEDIARECITDLVNEYLLETQFNLLMKTKYIPNMLKQTAEDAAKETAIEEILNDLLGRMITELAPAMFESQYEEVVQEVESKELEKGMKNHIRRGILRALIDNLASIIIVKAEKEQIADEMMGAQNIAYVDDEDLALKDT